MNIKLRRIILSIENIEQEIQRVSETKGTEDPVYDVPVERRYSLQATVHCFLGVSRFY